MLTLSCRTPHAAPLTSSRIPSTWTESDVAQRPTRARPVASSGVETVHATTLHLVGLAYHYSTYAHACGPAESLISHDGPTRIQLSPDILQLSIRPTIWERHPPSPPARFAPLNSRRGCRSHVPSAIREEGPSSHDKTWSHDGNQLGPPAVHPGPCQHHRQISRHTVHLPQTCRCLADPMRVFGLPPSIGAD